MFRQKIFISLGILVLAFGVVGTRWLIVNKPKPRVAAPAAPRRVVRTQVLKKRDKTLWINGFGTVRPKTSLEVVPEVSGRVIHRAPGFRTGGFIEAGELLFQIDPAEIELEITRSRAEIERLGVDISLLEQQEQNHRADLDIAERHMKLIGQEVQRNKKLRRQGVISSGQYDQSQQNFLRQERTVQAIRSSLALLPVQVKQKRAVLEVNQSSLERALLHLSRTKIIAPFDARVQETNLDVGDFASAGKPAGTIYDVSVVEVPVSLPAQDVRWVFRRLPDVSFPRSQEEVSQFFPTAKVSWKQGERNFEWDGRVSLINAGLDESTRTLTLVVEIPEPTKNWEVGERPPLIVGMFVQVRIKGVTLRDVFVIPRHALRAQENVYLLDEGKLRIQKVEVIRKSQDGVIIKNGVHENAHLVLSAIPDPVAGMTLNVNSGNGRVSGVGGQ